MTDKDPQQAVRDALADLGVEHEFLACDPALADTAVFCEHYGFRADDSANTILVKSKTGERRYVACVLLADSRLDVNRVVRKKLEARRVSFAGADETRALTGMELGGVTPLALPPDMQIWVDARVMERPWVILGGGSRSCKLRVSPGVFELTPNTEIVEGLAQPAGA